jgi:AraC family transcriptional regulator
MPSERDILQLLHEIRGRLGGDVSLDALAARAGWSPFHFHRAFRRVIGETPKQYTLRLRLERAAARLATGADPVLSIAADAGFASHEVFTRAFRRRFGCTPRAYRGAALSGATPQTRARHRALTDTTGPCVGLFHLPITQTQRRITMPTLSIERRELIERPVLFVRLRTARHELPAAIAEGVGKAYMYSQKAGIALAGHPLTRYLSTGPGLLEVQVGLPIAATAPGEGDVESGILPAGSAAVGIHAGPYEQLAETYAAIERWMEANGQRPGGPPWEWYVTDPAEHPDPADWRTEVYWPIVSRS